MLFRAGAFIRINTVCGLALLHSERPKLHTILAFLSAVGLIIFFLKNEVFSAMHVFVNSSLVVIHGGIFV